MLIKNKSLASIKNPLNSFLIEKEFTNVEQIFKEIVSQAEDLPRRSIIKKDKYYWRGVCRSLIFRLPDDLEILIKEINDKKTSKGIIQIRSASRIGQSDLGVNQRRVNHLITKVK